MPSSRSASGRRCLQPMPWVLGLALLAPGLAARAEGPVQTLTLNPSQRFAHAKSALAQGTANTEPQRYAVEQTNILQPVSVTLVAPADSGLKLVLSKVAAEPLRQATIGPKGLANLKFRTEGGFYAAVHGGSKPAPYYLLVLVGDEQKRRPPSIVVPMSKFLAAQTTPAAAGTTPGASLPWPWLVAGGALVVAVGAVAWALGRRTSK